MACDMCGKITEQLNIAKVESVMMNVCKDCTKYGEFVRRIKPEQKIKKEKSKQIEIAPRNKIIFIINEKYGQLIKNSRERLNLKQEDLAQKLNEKESLVQKIESGKKEPSLAMARKLEQFLRIKLVEKQEIGKADKGAIKTSGPLTIGDMIKLIKK